MDLDISKWMEDMLKAVAPNMKKVVSINFRMKATHVPIVTIEKIADEEMPEILKFMHMIPWAQPILPSEYLFGFVAWITTREKEVKAGSKNDCSVWAELVKEFCEANDLRSPRDNYPENIIFPKEKK